MDVMNQLAERGDDVSGPVIRMDLLDEVDSYKSMDPVLADLYKQYLDARAVYGSLLRSHGVDDPMVQVAEDRLESCLSAFETRLIELRQDMALRQAAVARLQTMRTHMERLDEENHRASQKYKKRMQEYAEERRIDRARAESESSFATFLLLCSMLRYSSAHAYQSLRVANAFFAASAVPHDRHGWQQAS
jgi:hypothetical protein